MGTDWREDFVALLSSPRQEDWQRAFALRLQHLPSALFRYRRPDKNALDSLQRGTVWLSAASAFNDLHDTSVHVDAAMGINALLRRDLANGAISVPTNMLSRLAEAPDPFRELGAIFAEEVAKQQPEAEERAKHFLEDFAAKHAIKITTQLSEFAQRAIKVACFCESGTLSTLWAHYADSHKGFCIEYPFTGLARDDFRIHWLLPVVYSPDRFSLTSLIERLDGAMNPFIAWLASIHKSPDWAQEREWRIVNNVGDTSIGTEWLMPKPSRILLGHRMEAVFRQQLMEIALGQAIPLFDVVPSHAGFDLELVPMTATDGSI